MRRVTPIFLLLILSLVVLPVSAQTKAQSDWSAVAALPPDATVEVRQKSGPTIRGQVVSATDTTLTLKTRSQPAVSIQRQDVARIYHLGKRHVALGALIGGGAGVAGGAGAGAAVCGPHGYCTTGEGVGTGIAIFGGIGAVVGALIGLHRSHALIYRMP